MLLPGIVRDAVHNLLTWGDMGDLFVALAKPFPDYSAILIDNYLSQNSIIHLKTLAMPVSNRIQLKPSGIDVCGQVRIYMCREHVAPVGPSIRMLLFSSSTSSFSPPNVSSPAKPEASPELVGTSTGPEMRSPLISIAALSREPATWWLGVWLLTEPCFCSC